MQGIKLISVLDLIPSLTLLVGEIVTLERVYCNEQNFGDLCRSAGYPRCLSRLA